MKMEIPDNFSEEITDYFVSFINALADSIDKLANVQKNYPDKYDSVKKLEEDPGSIEEFTKTLSGKERDVLLFTLIKMSTLARRVNKILEYNVDEKKALVKDLKKFADEVKGLTRER